MNKGWAFHHLSTKEAPGFDQGTFGKHCHISLSHWTSLYLCLSPPFFLRRSCSIDKCPLSPRALSLVSQKRDMVRSESLRADPGERTHRIFRPSDLIHGEVLGKGCFGQAVKVLLLLSSLTARLSFLLKDLSVLLKVWLPQGSDDTSRCPGNASGDRGSDGDEGTHPVWWRNTEDILKGGKWWSEQRKYHVWRFIKQQVKTREHKYWSLWQIL